MIINIFGSTGVIGKKTLELIDLNFPQIKVNLLCSKSNITLLKKQIKKYNPKYAFLYDSYKIKNFNHKIYNTKFLKFNELLDYLFTNKSDLSVLAISGYKSLYFLESIIQNTNNLGIANKECIVSAGHIFKKKKYFTKTNIFPLDSEHFSLYEVLKNQNNFNKIHKIILTASGGPFFRKKYISLNNIKFKQAIDHPKWKMGYKNSIDSATLVNKCLEIVEAHYLFNIPYNKIDILIHPEAFVHSVIEFENYISQFNLFKNDMKIPILNFLINSNAKYINQKNKFSISDYNSFNFEKVTNDVFPIYKFFKKINKKIPQNIIKFNIGNEYAVNLFKNNMIKYTDIYKIITKVTSLNLYSPVNNIKDIINYHEEVENKLQIIKINNS